MCDCKEKQKTPYFADDLNELLDSIDELLRLEEDLEKTATDIGGKYNLINVDDTEKILEIAVPGFEEDEISVTEEDDTLLITCHKKDSENVDYIAKNLHINDIEQMFMLSDSTFFGGIATKAILHNGMLRVHISRTAKKPTRNIPVNESKGVKSCKCK
jgi:molecular chaperone IbpA